MNSNDMADNPYIYLLSSKKEQIHVVFLNEMYRMALEDRINIMAFHFGQYATDTMTFDDIGAFKTILEEMIHQCLPDPSLSLFGHSRINESAWKICLINLLEEYYNDHAK